MPQVLVVKIGPALTSAMDEGDKAGRPLAEKAKNNLIQFDVSETQRWLRTVGTVEREWVGEMTKEGIDGKRLVEEARAMIQKHAK